MITVADTVLLATTKLKTRRIRQVVLLVTMSVLFAGLVFVASITSGTIRSLRSFSAEGFGNRFLVQAHPMTYQSYGNTVLIDQLKPLQDSLIVQKTALAKKLGIPYDSKTDTSLYYTNQQVGPRSTDVQPILNGSALANAALNSQNAAISGIDFGSFTKRAMKMGATHTYRSASSNVLAKSGNVSVLLEGKEDYANDQEQHSATGIGSLQGLGWNQMSSELMRPFVLNGQTTAVGTDGSIPIIAPYSAAEQILGLPKLPATAATDQKLQRLTQVRQQIASKTAQLCYRNTASEELLQKAIQQQTEITTNKGKAGYELPHLLYNLPTEVCGSTTVKSDKRTADEKTSDKNQQAFNDAFTPNQPATQGVIVLRIVGISPDIDTAGNSFSAGGLLSGVLSSTIGFGWFSPDTAFVSGSIAAQAQNGTMAEQPVVTQTYYADFSTLAKATTFIKQANCSVNESSAQMTANYNPNAEVIACVSKGSPFTVLPYGNNAGAIADLQHTIWKFLRFALLAVVIIAVIIMMGTFGKVIADGRRETAVFRSLGASRLAISQIYLTYTLFVGVLVAIFAFGLGTIGAEVLNRRLEPGMSVNAVLTYNAHDVHKQFTVSGFDWRYALAILGLILGSALLSALIPIVMNMRRNPIRDMRDE